MSGSCLHDGWSESIGANRVLAWALVLSMGVALPAWSESGRKPAVSQINGSVSGFYLGSYQSQALTFVGSNAEWNNSGGVAADVYAPVGSSIGLAVSGGGRWGGADDWTFSPFIVTTSSDLSSFFVGADVFWRDPEAGFVGLFYDYARTRIEHPSLIYSGIPGTPPFPFKALERADLNDLELRGGLYLAEVDLTFEGGYERLCSTFGAGRATDPLQCLNGFDLGVGVAGYPGRSDRFRIGAAMNGGQPNAGRTGGEVSAIAFVDWQPGFFGNRLVRLGASVGGGTIVWSGGAVPYAVAGFSVSVDLPGSDGLKQLFREMRF